MIEKYLKPYMTATVLEGQTWFQAGQIELIRDGEDVVEIRLPTAYDINENRPPRSYAFRILSGYGDDGLSRRAQKLLDAPAGVGLFEGRIWTVHARKRRLDFAPWAPWAGTFASKRPYEWRVRADATLATVLGSEAYREALELHVLDAARVRHVVRRQASVQRQDQARAESEGT